MKQVNTILPGIEEPSPEPGTEDGISGGAVGTIAGDNVAVGKPTTSTGVGDERRTSGFCQM